MLYLQEFTFDSPKLFVFCLGGNIERSRIEMHDVVFIVAKTDTEAAEKIRNQWYGTEKSLHVDSWYIVEEMDGFEIKLSSDKVLRKEPSLYFVNLGYYKQGLFGESHFMTLTIASSKTEAIEKAKNQCSKDAEMLHIDNVYDVDDCIRIEEVDDYFISLEYSGLEGKALLPVNGYQKLYHL